MYHARPEVAAERFNQLVNFLEEHGETGIARQAQVVKESGGIREALHFITDKAAEGFPPRHAKRPHRLSCSPPSESCRRSRPTRFVPQAKAKVTVIVQGSEKRRQTLPRTINRRWQLSSPTTPTVLVSR